MYKILIVDDEMKMRKIVGDFLKREGYHILEASNGAEAFDIYDKNHDIAVIILDVMMPEYDGWSLLKQIRKESKIPVIMLTAKTMERDEVYGFEMGADEYIKKPFVPSVLVARVKALLRRTDINATLTNIGGLVVNEESREVFLNNEKIDLAPKEYILFDYLVRNRGLALSREQIITTVWEDSYEGELRTVDTHIRRLREKLMEKGECIKTIRGYGYMFEVAK